MICCSGQRKACLRVLPFAQLFAAAKWANEISTYSMSECGSWSLQLNNVVAVLSLDEVAKCSNTRVKAYANSGHHRTAAKAPSRPVPADTVPQNLLAALQSPPLRACRSNSVAFPCDFRFLRRLPFCFQGYGSTNLLRNGGCEVLVM